MTDLGAAPPAPTETPRDESGRRDRLRWLGLEPYGEEHQALYHGRGEEVGDLQRLVRGNRLTLLIGKMGSGKTSLLRAGFLPREREAGCLGVYVRPDLSAGAPKLGVQVMRAIDAEAREAGLQGPRPADAQSLWEYLHLQGGEFWTEDYQIALPIIVLDQFEEILTADQSNRRADCEAFLSELSDLIEGRVPKELRLQVLDDPPGDPRYAPKRHHYKIVVGLREESLAELDRHRRVLPPALFHRRSRLTPMNGEQALEVVTEAGAGVVGGVVAEQIVRKVADNQVMALRDLEVEPAILSVFCRWLDDQRAKKGLGQITQDLLDRFGDRILLDFYEDSLKELPGRSRRRPTWFVHSFIESKLLTDQDTRTQADPPDAPQRRFRVDRAAVRGLEARHVLRVEKIDQKDQVQLSHDVLIEPVRQSGRRRRRRLLRGLVLLAGIGLPTALGFGLVTGVIIGSRGPSDEVPEDLRNAAKLSGKLNLVLAGLDSFRTAASQNSSAAAERALTSARTSLDSIRLLCGLPVRPSQATEATPEIRPVALSQGPITELSCAAEVPLFRQWTLLESALPASEGAPFQEPDTTVFDSAGAAFQEKRDEINDSIRMTLSGS